MLLEFAQKTQNYDRKIGLFVLFGGLFMMGFWLFGQAPLHRLFPFIFIMVFNTSLCFMVSGSWLAIPGRSKKFQVLFDALKIWLNYLLIIFASLCLFQSLFNISLGIDEMLVNVTVNTNSIHPGRMSPQTSFSFLLMGIIFLLIQNLDTKFKQKMAFIMIFSILILAILQLIGFFLSAEMLYDWQKYGRMAPHTAIGFILLSFALLQRWFWNSKEHDYHFLKYSTAREYIIIFIITFFISVMILIGLILLQLLLAN